MATKTNQTAVLYSCIIGVRASLMCLSEAPTASQLALMAGLGQCVATPGIMVTRTSTDLVTGDSYTIRCREYYDRKGFLVGCVAVDGGSNERHIPAAPAVNTLPAIEDMSVAELLAD